MNADMSNVTEVFGYKYYFKLCILKAGENSTLKTLKNTVDVWWLYLAAAMPVVTPVDAIVKHGSTNVTVQCVNATVVAWYQLSTGRTLTSEIIDDFRKTQKYIIEGDKLTIMSFGKADPIPYSCGISSQT